MKAPRINEIWQVSWHQGGAKTNKENNILVRIYEDKTEFNPPNWRENNYKCEHHGKELIVHGGAFIEKWGYYPNKKEDKCGNL